MTSNRHAKVAIIGGGFTGLAAAYELTKNGVDVQILEADEHVGGLAAAFEVGGEKLERFYHHWFTNDVAIMDLIHKLGMDQHLQINPSRTGMYYANNFFKLSTPMDLLKFSPLSFFNRLRLGWFALRARSVKDWKVLESKTAMEWIRGICGDQVFKVVWEPLLRGKFGVMADRISAVWFWNKLKLRGSSRGSKGEEKLAYFKGGFVRLADRLAETIVKQGGCIQNQAGVSSLAWKSENKIWEIQTSQGHFTADHVLVTTALPLFSEMIQSWASTEYIAQLNRIHYLANVCLILELDRSLSSTYWLNVNDPSFPFVAVIEHTNFIDKSTYQGRNIVYLSKYLPHTDSMYSMSKDDIVKFAIPHIKKMFPKFESTWILGSHVWKARWAQPIVEKNYTQMIPAKQTPYPQLYLCSMAQIYPEDRGTNYAVRDGRDMACLILKKVKS